MCFNTHCYFAAHLLCGLIKVNVNGLNEFLLFVIACGPDCDQRYYLLLVHVNY